MGANASCRKSRHQPEVPCARHHRAQKRFSQQEEIADAQQFRTRGRSRAVDPHLDVMHLAGGKREVDRPERNRDGCPPAVCDAIPRCGGRREPNRTDDLRWHSSLASRTFHESLNSERCRRNDSDRKERPIPAMPENRAKATKGENTQRGNHCNQMPPLFR